MKKIKTDTSLKTFGSAIRKLRMQKGLSQEQLSELCNLHRTYVGGIERGERNVSLINILQIAKALEIHPRELFQDMNENTTINYEQELKHHD